MPRTVRAAYTVAPVLACLIAFLGLFVADQDGSVGQSFSITAVGGAGSANNARVADALESSALRSRATLVRIVTDRSEPSRRRTLLVTTAPGSMGAEWLAHGYPDFTRSMTTRVRPMSDLDRYDATADYQVIGNQRSAAGFAETMRRAVFEVKTTAVPTTVHQVLGTGLTDLIALVLVSSLGCASLCVVSTAGAPRRFALRRMAGHRRHIAAALDLVAVRASVVAAVVVAGPIGAALSWYNGLARVGELAACAGAASVVLLAPVVVAHGIGAGIAARVPIAVAVRGRRPAGSTVVLIVLARIPAMLLLVVSCFDLVSSSAVVESGGAARDVRAAGSAAQLWITAEPHPEIATQQYWNRFGRFAGAQLAHGGAFLSAVGELGGPGEPVPVLFVDSGYLRHHPLTASDGTSIERAETPVVWLSSERRARRGAIVDEVRAWSLGGRAHEVGSATLADHTRVYTYPGDDTVTSWLDDPVVVVVPDPAAVFTEDQLGSWLSSGDIVFEDAARAQEALGRADLAAEVSAVVGVGQEAAERARAAAVDQRVDAGVFLAAATIAALVAVLAAVVQRRRFGQGVFARFAAGWSPWRADRSMLLGEVAFLLLACCAAGKEAWDRGVGHVGLNAATDPRSVSTMCAPAFAVSAALVVCCISVIAIRVTAQRTVRAHGRET